jgi:hypothetical protein
MAQPWEQRHSESAKAFAAFKAYRDLGEQREFLAAYRQLTGKSNARKQSGQWQRWSSDHEWKARALAYDRNLEQVAERARVASMKAQEKKWADRRETIREDAFATGTLLVEKAQKMGNIPITQQVIEKVEEVIVEKDSEGRPVTVHRTINHITVIPGKWDFGTAARLLEVGNSVRRLAAGMATEHVTSDIQLTQDSHAGIDDGVDLDARVLEILERVESRSRAAEIDAERAGGDAQALDPDRTGGADEAPEAGSSSLEALSGPADDGLLQSG